MEIDTYKIGYHAFAFIAKQMASLFVQCKLF